MQDLRHSLFLLCSATMWCMFESGNFVEQIPD